MFGLAVAACSGSDGSDPASSPSSSAASEPPPPSVRGRFIVLSSTETSAPDAGAWPRTDYSVWQFDVGPGAGPKTTRLASPARAGGAAVSPDGKWLAYTKTKSLVLRDLANGRERVIPSKDTNDCVRWSPDSRRVATALNGGLDLVDVDGHVTTVDRSRTNRYTDGTDKHTAKGRVTCPDWLDAHRLVYDRLTSFPSFIKGTPQTIDADTTTLAVLRDGRAPRLVDSAGRWTLVAACGNRVITANEKTWSRTAPPKTLYVLDRLDEAALAVRDGTMPPARAIDTGFPELSPWTVTFIPGSCRPVISGNEAVFSVDTAGRRVDTRPLVRNVSEYAFLDGYAWSPERDTDTFVTGDGRVYDLGTGGSATLGTDAIPHFSAVLAWLPDPA